MIEHLIGTAIAALVGGLVAAWAVSEGTRRHYGKRVTQLRRDLEVERRERRVAEAGLEHERAMRLWQDLDHARTPAKSEAVPA